VGKTGAVGFIIQKEKKETAIKKIKLAVQRNLVNRIWGILPEP